MEAEKPVKWVGASLKDLQAMPEEVKDEIGFILSRVQQGKSHQAIRPLAGLRGVSEIRSDHDSDTYRVVYVVNLPDAIYVLHAFKKKSTRGISTPRYELEVIRTRLSRAKEASDEKRRSR